MYLLEVKRIRPRFTLLEVCECSCQSLIH